MDLRCKAPGRQLGGAMFVVALALALLAPTEANAQQRTKIVVLGDSLSSAYNMPKEYGWVELFAARLRSVGTGYTVVNASVAGETSTGGLARLPAILERHDPEVLVIELGGNDGLRRRDNQVMGQNLWQMVDLAKRNGTQVVLLGMKLPDSLHGAEYAAHFHQMFEWVAEQHQIAWVPFMLEPFALNLDYFLPDKIHPTHQAQPLILEHCWQMLWWAVESMAVQRAG